MYMHVGYYSITFCAHYDSTIDTNKILIRHKFCLYIIIFAIESNQSIRVAEEPGSISCRLF
jgi:hypothetical protein